MSLRPARTTAPSLDWVLVANGARARLFVRDADNGALREVSDHVHPGSRMTGAELGGERAGQARKSDAATAFTARETPHEHERAALALDLTAWTGQELEQRVTRALPG